MRLGRVAELVERMRIHQPSEAQELTDSLAPIELQPGRAGREEQPPQLAGAEEVAEFRFRHVDQEQDQDPLRNGGKPMPRKVVAK